MKMIVVVDERPDAALGPASSSGLTLATPMGLANGLYYLLAGSIEEAMEIINEASVNAIVLSSVGESTRRKLIEVAAEKSHQVIVATLPLINLGASLTFTATSAKLTLTPAQNAEYATYKEACQQFDATVQAALNHP